MIITEEIKEALANVLQAVKDLQNPENEYAYTGFNQLNDDIDKVREWFDELEREEHSQIPC